MIVCHCNALRERDVRAKVATDCRRVTSLYARLGAKPKCKQCLPFAFQLMADERARLGVAAG